MIGAIVFILIILWVVGYLPVSGLYVPNIPLITIGTHTVTLWELLILLVIGWAIGILPRPFQVIAGVLLLLWILSVLGIFAFADLPSILVIVIIIVLIVALFL